MNELIKITEYNGRQAVSARELHCFLESKQEFSNWIKSRIEKYGLIENEDFSSFDKVIKRDVGATTQKEYALTMDAAKELAMVEGNDKGKQARRYFIECEKQLKQRPVNAIDATILALQELKAAQERLHTVEDKVRVLEAKSVTHPDYFTISGYASLHGVHLPLKKAVSYGRRASAMCRDKGISTETTPDPRFGLVKTYPTKILDELFD